jgi:hypothetical protein
MEYLKLENNIKPGFQEAGNVEGWLLAEFERGGLCNLCQHVELGKISYSNAVISYLNQAASISNTNLDYQIYSQYPFTPEHNKH